MIIARITKHSSASETHLKMKNNNKLPWFRVTWCHGDHPIDLSPIRNVWNQQQDQVSSDIMFICYNILYLIHARAHTPTLRNAKHSAAQNSKPTPNEDDAEASQAVYTQMEQVGAQGSRGIEGVAMLR